MVSKKSLIEDISSKVIFYYIKSSGFDLLDETGLKENLGIYYDGTYSLRGRLFKNEIVYELNFEKFIEMVGKKFNKDCSYLEIVSNKLVKENLEMFDFNGFICRMNFGEYGWIDYPSIITFEKTVNDKKILEYFGFENIQKNLWIIRL